MKILNDDVPPLRAKWSPLFTDFVGKCLIKDETDRPTANQLLQHPFLENAELYREEFSKAISEYKH